MADTVHPPLTRRRLHLRLVSGQLDQPAGSPRLISLPDTVISRTLREQTRMVLATLTPYEQAVLRMRFGIGSPGPAPRLGSATRACIEARALRKLRHPNPRARLKGVARE